jgi:hypothetical protein
VAARKTSVPAGSPNLYSTNDDKQQGMSLETRVLQLSTQIHKHVSYLSLEAFAATEFNKIYTGRQPLQHVKIFRRFEH